MTQYIRTRRTLKIIKEEIRCGSNTDIYYFGYPLSKAISRKQNTILDKESLIIKH